MGTSLILRLASDYLAEMETEAYRTKSRWQEWLDSVHDGGRKKVPNPNPETARRFPQVSFSSALKNESFRAKAMEDFKKWSEENPKGDGKKKTTPKKEEPKVEEKHTKIEDIPPRGLKVGNITVTSRISTPEEKATLKKTFGDKAPSAETLSKMFGIEGDFEGTMSIYESRYSHEIKVEVNMRTKSGANAAQIYRTFHKDSDGKLVVHHDLLKLDDAVKGKGAGSSILKNSFEGYKKIGVNRIEQACAWDGQYVWPRMGYKMDAYSFRKSKENLKKRVLEKLNLPKELAKQAEDWLDENIKTGQDIADLHLPDGTPIGKETLLHGSMIDVSLDLEDGDPNYERMKSYLAGDKGKPKKFDPTLEQPLSPGVDQDWGEQYKVALRKIMAQEEDKKDKKPESDDLATELMDLADEGPKKTMPDFSKSSKLPLCRSNG